MSNLDIWNKLGKTDPDQTKSFKRGGGFSGTAIKPIYTEQKMTEQFGPCGTGWGFTEPRFELVPGSEGQTAVYCWLSLWYVLDGKRSEGIPGVGGDFVVVKQSSGLRTNDEAFKAAFTDAIGNAMKHLGMSADVHMGRFDDSKYVRQLQEEARQERQDIKPEVDLAFAQLQFIQMARSTVKASCHTVSDLAEWMEKNGPEAARLGIRKGSEASTQIREIVEARRKELEGDDPDAWAEAAE